MGIRRESFVVVALILIASLAIGCGDDDMEDAGGGSDSAVDTQEVDAREDSAPDAEEDAASDAEQDASEDVAPDAEPDASPDGSQDGAADAREDAGDSSLDAGDDAPDALADSGDACTDDCGEECALPRLECGGSCVDVRSDDMNCGECGNACAAPLACINSECGTPAMDGEDCDRRDSDADRFVDEGHLMVVRGSDTADFGEEARGAFRLTREGEGEFAIVDTSEGDPRLTLWNGAYRSLELPSLGEEPELDVCGGRDAWHVLVSSGNTLSLVTFRSDGGGVFTSGTREIPLRVPDGSNLHLARCAVSEVAGSDYIGITYGLTAAPGEPLRLGTVILNATAEDILYSGRGTRPRNDRFEELDIIATKGGLFTVGTRGVSRFSTVNIERLAINLTDPIDPTLTLGDETDLGRRKHFSAAYLPELDSVIVLFAAVSTSANQWRIARMNGTRPGRWPTALDSTSLTNLGLAPLATRFRIASAGEGRATRTFAMLRTRTGRDGYYLERYRWAMGDDDPVPYDPPEAAGTITVPSALIGASWPTATNAIEGVPGPRYLALQGADSYAVSCF